MRLRECPECGGTGRDRITTRPLPCPACHGQLPFLEDQKEIRSDFLVRRHAQLRDAAIHESLKEAGLH